MQGAVLSRACLRIILHDNISLHLRVYDAAFDESNVKKIILTAEHREYVWVFPQVGPQHDIAANRFTWVSLSDKRKSQ